MRNKRAKVLRREAVKNPSPRITAVINKEGTIVLGGWKRKYRDLKKSWTQKVTAARSV